MSAMILSKSVDSLQIPATAYLEKVWTEAVSPGLWAELLCLAALFASRPLADNMARFEEWRDRKEVLTRFCREYFLEEPMLKTEDFTLTRHYLADERGMIGFCV